MGDKKIDTYTLGDYLESLKKDADANKDADFVVLQANIRQRLKEDIVKIGMSLTVKDMPPPLMFAFLHYFLFFWDHIEPYIESEKEKDFLKTTINDIMSGNKPDGEKLSTH